MPEGDGDQKANTSQAGASVNLAKNLMGVGIFTMPLALLHGSVITGLSVMIFAGVVQGSSFVLIAFLCQRLGCSSYRTVFAAGFGPRAGAAVDACIMINSFVACVSYCVLVADFLEKAVEGLFDWQDVPRPALIWSLTLVITLPLSHARNLSPLRYTSMLGLAIIAFVFCYIFGDFWYNLSSSKVNLQTNVLSLNMGVFKTLALCTGAFQAHYNSPKIFRELGCDLKAHACVTVASFTAAFFIYFLFAISGLGLFGDELEGNVLKNYPAEGNFAILFAWLGMAFAIVFTYPLVFTTGRDSMIGLLPVLQRAAERQPTPTHILTTSGPVLLISTVACFVTDVSVVTGLLGATIGACLCWIFPAMAYLAVTSPPGPVDLEQQQQQENEEKEERERQENNTLERAEKERQEREAEEMAVPGEEAEQELKIPLPPQDVQMAVRGEKKGRAKKAVGHQKMQHNREAAEAGAQAAARDACADAGQAQTMAPPSVQSQMAVLPGVGPDAGISPENSRLPMGDPLMGAALPQPDDRSPQAQRNHIAGHPCMRAFAWFMMVIGFASMVVGVCETMGIV